VPCSFHQPLSASHTNHHAEPAQLTFNKRGVLGSCYSKQRRSCLSSSNRPLKWHLLPVLAAVAPRSIHRALPVAHVAVASQNGTTLHGPIAMGMFLWMVQQTAAMLANHQLAPPDAEGAGPGAVEQHGPRLD
jgi:hypothetical protein